MPELLFKLNNVPDDEADEVRELLTAQGIDFYETSAGRWGFSIAGIWLRDEDLDRCEQARGLIDDYQRGRVARVREAYRRQREQGLQPDLFDLVKQQPLRYLLVLAFLLFILYVSLAPFLGML